MSSEGKVPNPGDQQLDSDGQHAEAELADSPPLAEVADDSGSAPPNEPDVVVAQAVDAAPEAEIASDLAIDAAQVSGGAITATAVGLKPKKISALELPPPIAKNLENLSANGGALGALVLGIWCFLGAFITNWSIINGVLGLLLGAWGLTSRRKKTAWVGIVFCTIGIIFCLAEFNELVNEWLFEVDDTLSDELLN